MVGEKASDGGVVRHDVSDLRARLFAHLATPKQNGAPREFQVPSHLPLLATHRTDDLEAIFILLGLLILLLVGFHGPLDVLDPFLKRQHAPEARFVMFHPTPCTSHDPHDPLFAGPKGLVADWTGCRNSRGIAHPDD